MRKVLAGALLVCLCSLGCGTPGWVERTPTKPGYIYAVGRWQKTYYANQRERAEEDARAAVARAIHTRVNEFVLHVQTRYGAATRDRLRRVASSITDTELEGCEAVAVWTDERGRVGPAQTMYALARIRRVDAAKAIQKAAGVPLAAEDKETLEQILQQLETRPGAAE